MNYSHITVVGNATDDAEKKVSKKGDVEYATFDVAVSDGKEKTSFLLFFSFHYLFSDRRKKKNQ